MNFSPLADAGEKNSVVNRGGSDIILIVTIRAEVLPPPPGNSGLIVKKCYGNFSFKHAFNKLQKEPN